MWWALSYFVYLAAAPQQFRAIKKFNVMKKPHAPLISSLDPQAALRWSLAAATGLLLAGCPENKPKTDAEDTKTEAAHAAHDGEEAKDKECCMGKNECKGKGGCAVPESNDCAGKNECKGKGGCNMHCPK